MIAKITAEQNKGIISLVLLTLGFGMIAVVARYLGSELKLFQQLYLTLGAGLIGSLFLTKPTLTFDRLQKIPQKDWLIMIGRTVVGYLIAASLYRQSIMLTKISNVTFIQSIPIAAFFGWLLFKEKFSFRKAVLLTVSFAGVIIISVRDWSALTVIGRGELYSLISAILFSLSFISRKWQTDDLNDKEIAQLLLALGTVMLMTVSVVSGEGWPAAAWSLGLIAAIFLNGFLNAVNLYLINFGFKRVPVVIASNILTLESVFALVLAFIFYRELPNIKELLGGLLIVASVFQMNRIRDQVSV